MNKFSLKSQAVNFLKSKGIKTLEVNGENKKLKHVKTNVLVSEAVKRGF